MVARENVRHESDIRNSHLAADQPLLFAQHTLKHAKHARNFVLVSLLCARDRLGMVLVEPRRLAEVRTLAGRLEEQPLELLVLVLWV